jgi:hypothetical protein
VGEPRFRLPFLSVRVVRAFYWIAARLGIANHTVRLCLFPFAALAAAHEVWKAGSSVDDCMKITGHKTSSMFKRYADLFSDEEKRAQQRAVQAVSQIHSFTRSVIGDGPSHPIYKVPPPQGLLDEIRQFRMPKVRFPIRGTATQFPLFIEWRPAEWQTFSTGVARLADWLCVLPRPRHFHTGPLWWRCARVA